MSGGVMIADSTRIATNACFRYLINNAGDTIPNLVSRKIMIGNSKNNPLKRVVVVIIDI